MTYEMQKQVKEIANKYNSNVTFLSNDHIIVEMYRIGLTVMVSYKYYFVVDSIIPTEDYITADALRMIADFVDELNKYE